MRVATTFAFHRPVTKLRQTCQRDESSRHTFSQVEGQGPKARATHAPVARIEAEGMRGGQEHLHHQSATQRARSNLQQVRHESLHVFHVDWRVAHVHLIDHNIAPKDWMYVAQAALRTVLVRQKNDVHACDEGGPHSRLPGFDVALLVWRGSQAGGALHHLGVPFAAHGHLDHKKHVVAKR